MEFQSAEEKFYYRNMVDFAVLLDYVNYDNVYGDFFDELKGSSDEEIEQTLIDLNKIDKQDLGLAVTLLNEISTKEGRERVMNKLLKNPYPFPEYDRFGTIIGYSYDCNGAITPAMLLVQPKLISELTKVLSLNITGADLYALWNDCSNYDTNKFIINIWALISGVYNPNDVAANFYFNHEFANNIAFQKSFENSRRCAVPFVCDDDVINPRDYIKNLEKVGPKDEEYKNYIRANKKLVFSTGAFLEPFSSLITGSGLKIEYECINNYNIRMTIFSDKNSAKLESPFKDGDSIEVSLKQIIELCSGNEAKNYNHLGSINFSKSTALNILQFLRCGKDKFLPNFVVIQNFPLAEIEDFYKNGNDKRFGNLVQKSEFTDYESREGLFKLAYLVGCFSEKASESELAYKFLEEHVIGQISGWEIHKTYGAIPLQGFKRDFAKFFMINFAKDKNCFYNKVGAIYEYFEKILELRSEKEIDTTTDRKMLTPADAIAVIDEEFVNQIIKGLGLQNSDADSNIVQEICMYTSSKDAITWAIDTLHKAAKIAPEDIKIPYIKNSPNKEFHYRVIEKCDPEIVTVGYKTNCCFVYGGVAKESLQHAITSPTSSVVVFESKNCYLQGWIWYDEKNGLFCIDNLEGNQPTKIEEFMEALIDFADKIFESYKERGLPCKSVNLGVNDADMKTKIQRGIFDLIEKGMVKKEKNLKLDYVDYLYSDAREHQFILCDDELYEKHKISGGLDGMIKGERYKKKFKETKSSHDVKSRDRELFESHFDCELFL